MPKHITLFIKIIIIFLVFNNLSYGAKISITPLKKPILEEGLKKEKISKNIIKPQEKPSSAKKKSDQIKEKITKPLKKLIPGLLQHHAGVLNSVVFFLQLVVAVAQRDVKRVPSLVIY